ncbi:DUF6252 family protein [Hymenobacter armeniacus]|uniref:Lipid/polyisoprenoid-binding YceI-like domain-containing protein n=1 Tax=Hymenobacter armeniacus TaxID=2771358 RepID=A0ABR8JX85_9BACT|nr:DUF6252 family protein [Hymenobacter armeniacus]MBD2723408.1 hypothetical protein [Hymenobacter armeniacus]
MNKLLPFLALAAALAAGSCKKDNPDAGLPPATQEGKNTGGCLVNGERFVATGWGGDLFSNPTPPLFGGFSFDSVYTVDLNGQYKGENATLTLFLKNDVPKTYLLNKDTPYYPQAVPSRVLDHATFTIDGVSKSELYGTNSTQTGKVVLTRADLRAGIGSGTFEFTAASTVDRSKTITVTNGRFDRKQ